MPPPPLEVDEVEPLLEGDEDGARLAPGFSPKKKPHPAEMVLANKVFEQSVQERLPRSLAGKAVAVTGTTSGTGYWCALVAVQKGADAVFLLNRTSHRQKVSDADMEKAADRAGGKTAVHSIECDLTSFASVRAAATEISLRCLALYGGLDVLACNAGIMATADERTCDGYDEQMQVNHLSHFLLVKKLMPCLEAAAVQRGEARVVQHSSGARFFPLGPLKFGGKHFEQCPRNSLGGNSSTFAVVNFAGAQNVRYHHSKLANPVFAMALHAKLLERGSRVKSLVCEPGFAATSLPANGWQLDATRTPVSNAVFSAMMPAFRRLCQSGADGACPLLVACFSEEAGSGDFYVPEHQMLWCCGLGPYVKGAPIRTVVGGLPRKPKMEERVLKHAHWVALWEASEKAIGEKFLDP